MRTASAIAADIALMYAARTAGLVDGTWRVQTVAFADSSTTFASYEQWQKMMADLQSELTAANGTRTRYARTSKDV